MAQHDENSGSVNLDTCANILQATFKHYFEMAMNHHTKTATTSNILLVIIGAIIAFIGFDNHIYGVIDLGAAFAVFVIGLFGAVWALKQHERYYYWKHIAYKYQEELIKIVPMLKMGYSYYGSASSNR